MVPGAVFLLAACSRAPGREPGEGGVVALISPFGELGLMIFCKHSANA